MPDLRLHKPDENDPIPFPDVNRFQRRDEPRPADMRIQDRITEAFARMQADLDTLSEEIDDVFHMPDPDDDWPPSAA